jgi:4'-phosphopantetheinyl transferase
MPVVHCKSITEISWITSSAESKSLIATIKIWRFPVFAEQELLDLFYSTLDLDEKSKSFRFHHRIDHRRFVSSHGALRFLLGKYLNILPAEVQFCVGPNKKPLLKNERIQNLHFNMTHSGDWILIAVAEVPIGVDIEKKDEKFSYEEILPTNFCSGEIDFIRNSNPSVSPFYLLWTRKEALVKATAKGLDGDLILISVLDGQNYVDDKILRSNDRWDINSFEVEEHYIGSIACNLLNKTIEFLDGSQPSFFLQPV